MRQLEPRLSRWKGGQELELNVLRQLAAQPDIIIYVFMSH